MYSRPALDPAAGRTFSDAASREENSGRTRANPSRPPDGLLFREKLRICYRPMWDQANCRRRRLTPKNRFRGEPDNWDETGSEPGNLCRPKSFV